MPLDPQYLWWIPVFTAVLTAGVTLLLIPLARKLCLIDHPGPRKVHDSATPVTGGLAICITLIIVLFWVLTLNRFVLALIAGGLLMAITGVADDRIKLSSTLRFALQIIACLIMIVYADVYLEDFGRLTHDAILPLGRAALPVTVFAALGVINAFNMIDGLDGLAGSIFLVAAAGMALFAAQAGQDELFWTLLVSMGAVTGFLLFNARLPWNKTARVFLGDCGSLVLGFILAWSFISLGNDNNESGLRAFMPMTAVWLMAVPLLDTSTVMWRRLRAGRSPFTADQNHLHHAFLRAGFSVGQTWTNITLMALVGAAAGITFETSSLPRYFSFWTFIALAITYYLYIRGIWDKQRFLGRDFIYNEPVL